LCGSVEKQFDLPARFVQGAHAQRLDAEVVGQEHETLAGLGIFVSDAPQAPRVALLGVKPCQLDVLIAHQAAVAVDGHRVHAPPLEIGLGARDEEGARVVQGEQALEVHVGAIHHVDGTGLGQQHVQDVDVVQLAVRDEDECRDGSAQIQQGVQFDRGLGGSKRSPGKQRQAQIDGRRIQGVDGLL